MNKRIFISFSVILAILIIFIVAYSSMAGQRPKGADRVLSKVTFIHFKRGHAKPPWAGGGKKDKPNDEGSYAYISKGAYWKSTESLLLNPNCDENPDGSLDNLIINAVAAGIYEWEIAGGEESLQIFEDIYIDSNVRYNDGKYRGYNTISFGPYKNSDVIAVTSVWGYFTGPPSFRELIEAHILMNDDFEWGDAAVDDYLMDVQNIVTHELGHWAGMDDVYEVTAAEETMYGYSEEGEIEKRDLYKGDIAGITNLYK